MALSTAAVRAIAIRNNVARRAAANDNNSPTAKRTTKPAATKMHPRLLAMCVEAGGFDQNASYA